MPALQLLTRSARKREQIRTAAYRCFRDVGYHETTVDSVCETAGISKGSFYWHYSSKQEVYIDILQSWSRDVMDQLYEQFQQALRDRNAPSAMAEALARESHRGRAIVPLWLEFAVHARRDPEIRETLQKFFRRARSAIVEMFRPGLQGVCDERQLQGVAAAAFGAYAGLMMQELVDPEGAAAEQAYEAVLGLIALWTAGESAVAQVAAEKADLLDRPAREVEAFLEGCGDERGLVERLRELVLQTLPQAQEKVIAGWRVLAYGDGHGLVLYLKPRRASAHLGFYYGAELHDPTGLLRGTGKRMRHVQLEREGLVDDGALGGLIRAAWQARRV